MYVYGQGTDIANYVLIYSHRVTVPAMSHHPSAADNKPHNIVVVNTGQMSGSKCLYLSTV